MGIVSNIPMAMGTDGQQVIHPFFRQGQNVSHSRMRGALAAYRSKLVYMGIRGGYWLV
jgi:hypothetical protein